MKLKGHTALVTGGGRGIGRAISLAMAREGADIVVAADVKDDIDAVVLEIKELGRHAKGYVLDISRPEEVDDFITSAVNCFDNADILVNNAGVVGKRNFVHLSDDDVWIRTIKVNLFGTYFCTKAFLPHIIEKKKGRIINMASISGKQASPTNSAYASSKHAVIGFTRTLAAELGLLDLNNVTCNAICPGVVNTGMLTAPGMILDELSQILSIPRDHVLENVIKKMNIQHRVIEPEEVGDMAVYLASDAARGITGQAINVCGGSVFY